MKRMYKYLAVPVFAWLIAGCGFEEEPDPNGFIAAPEVEISVNELKDNSMVVNVAPKGEAGYYSVAVLPAEEAEGALDANKLYHLGYDSKIMNETFKYAEMQSVQKKLEGLQPKTDYVVCAVASGKTGNIGKVERVVVRTPDTGIPEVVGFEQKEEDFLIEFSEPIRKGYGEITLQTLSKLAFVNKIQQKPHTVRIPLDSVSCEGCVAAIHVGRQGYPGALCAISWDGKAFRDLSLDQENFAAPQVSKFGVNDKGIPGIARGGIGGRLPFKTWYIEGFSTAELSDEDVRKEILFELFPEGAKAGNVPLLALYDEKVTGATFSYVNDYRTFRIDAPIVGQKDVLTGFIDFGKDLPKPLDQIHISFPEGQFYDVFGNPSAKFDATFTYISLLSEIIGDYTVKARTLFEEGDKANYEYEAQIAPDGESSTTVKVSGLMPACNDYGVEPYRADVHIQDGVITGISIPLGSVAGCQGMDAILCLINADEEGHLLLSDEGEIYLEWKDGKLTLQEFDGLMVGIFVPGVGVLDGIVAGAEFTKVVGE